MGAGNRWIRLWAARAEAVDAVVFARFGLLVLGGIVLVAYAPVFLRWFFRDDFFLLDYARYTWSASQPLRFVLHSHNGLFTPLANAVFWAQYRVFGLQASAYHLVSLLLHAVNAGLLGIFVYTVSGQRWTALFAAVLFAVTFSVQEAVSWIAAGAHLLALTFFMLALIATAGWIASRRRRDLWIAALALVAGLLVKEDFLVVPLILIALVVLAFRQHAVRQRELLFALSVFGLTGAVYGIGLVFWHRRADSMVQLGQFQWGWHALANYRALVGLLIPPPDYIPFVSMMNRLLPAWTLDVYTLVGWGLLLPLAGFLVWRFWKGSLLERIAVLMTVVAFAPFSLSTIGISLRYLYLPYAGFAILLGASLNRLWTGGQKGWVLALMVVFIVANSTGTWIWNVRMSRDTAEKRAIIERLRQDYDAGRIEGQQVCIVGLPRAISDVTIAVPVFTNRQPRPEVYMDEVFCPEGAFPYQYIPGGVEIRAP